MVEERTAQLRALSLRDPLTGLPNRRALRAEVVRKLADRRNVAIYFLMLDEIDELARTHGYAICEALSREVGDMLSQSALMRSGLVSSWGDREFVLMLEHDDDVSAFERNAARLTRLLE
ncbi:diguanylate cyclase, partial [Arthrospira platensis SPKY2]